MFRRFRKTGDFRSEIEAHLLIETDRLKEEGFSEQEAASAARRLFGNPTRAQEQFHQSRSWFVLGVLLQDVRFGLRILWKNRGATAVTVLTLALALGVNTAIFSVLHAALLQSFPARNPNELVMLTDPNASMVLGGLLTGRRSLLTFPEFTELRDHTRTLSGLCAAQLTLEQWQVRIANASPEQVRGRLVSENYFSVFGIQPAIGRFFQQEDATAVGKDPYAVISYDYWQRRFNGNATVLGTPIRLHQTTVVIIGVAAQGFRGETTGQEPAIWLPLLMQPIVTPDFDGLRDTLGESRDKLMWLHVFGRRKAAITSAQVQAEVSVLFRRMLAASYPPAMEAQARKAALRQYIEVSSIRGGAFHGRQEFAEQWILLAALAGLVLLVACFNVANLLLARAAARSGEVAIRLSLGAARVRLVWQFLTESLLLAALGGIAGLVVAKISLRALLQILSQAHDGFSVAARLDVDVLAFTACITLLTGVLFGMIPAIRATRHGFHGSLKEGGRGTTPSRERARFAKALVVAQVALSLLLAVAAGLFLRSLWNLQTVALGYPRDHLLLLVHLDSRNVGYQGERAANLSNELTRRLQEVPGVASASYSDRGLFSGFEGAFAVTIDGKDAKREEDRGSTGDSVGPGYFSTVGIPLLAGREIDSRDRAPLLRVGVINEAFARRFFAGVNPIGKHFRTVLSDQDGNAAGRQIEIVGVAKDVRVQSMRGAIDPKFYVPGGGAWFEVRTARDPNRVLAAARKAILAADPDLTILSARTLHETLEMQNGQPRLIAELALGFGVLALVVAAFGVYGLLSYGVARRTNEIGIRMALGAGRKTIMGMIAKETGVMIAMGVAAGVLMAAAGARLFTNQLSGMKAVGDRWSLARYEHVESATQLYGLTAMDPLTLGVAVAVLCVVGLIAAGIPAARAAQIDPASALRND